QVSVIVVRNLATDRISVSRALRKTAIKGPLGHGLSALLLGRSSASKQGIFILPGEIDADYTGVISIMIQALCPPVHIYAGTKIAQLIPFQAMVPTASSIDRKGGFGPTGHPQIAFLIPVGKDRPTHLVGLQFGNSKPCIVNALLDTGADVTVIS
ncbi:POK9 protein, partial [Geococcyx californianus]|nr:POK9 protein [Geococcyx californianus]